MIVAAFLGISLALWTAVDLQLSITRMQAGLELGREMVASLMPVGCHQLEGYEIARRLEPATEVGGDFYNWLRLVQRYRECESHEMVDRLFAALRSLPPLHEERDDMTVLIIRRSS